MEDYKKEIVSSRVGCLGGSDAKILMSVSKLCHVPRAAYERLAIAKGLIPPKDSYKTKEMLFGDYIEQSVFEYLSNDDSRYVSNPLWVSNKYSRKNIQLICHPDIVLFDDTTKTLSVYEVKATKFNVKSTKETYRGQMFIEWSIANELISDSKGWRVRLFLVHYDTNGIELDGHQFDPSRLSVHRMAFSRVFDINLAMDIIDKFLDCFDEYYCGEEIPSEYLPQSVQNEFAAITKVLNEIKEREKEVNSFKEKLYKFMREKDIKGINNDAWSITRVDETESVGFDSKAFIEDLTTKHPIKSKKILRQFEKRTKRKGYVTIKLK